MSQFDCIRAVMASVASVFLLTPLASLAQGSSDRDAREISGYKLTEAGVAKYRQAIAALGPLAAEADADGCDAQGNAESVDASVARINSVPGAQAAIQSAGMTTREYVVFTRALLQSRRAASAPANPDGTLPPGVSRANVDFYRAHAQALNRLVPQQNTAACGAAGSAAAPTTDGIRISIKNVYEVKINFGPVRKGWRKGTDMAEGVLRRQGGDYVGVVTASVESDQQVSGLGLNCGPAHYEDLQELTVTGRHVDGFNSLVQTVTFNQATSTGSPSGQFLALEFEPKTMTSQQPGPRLPEDMLPDLDISCHTLIDTLSGIAFLPLNDSRWTMEGGGYIIVVPTSGVLNYTDSTVPAAGGATLGPFEAKESIWTIQVERLP